MKIRRQFAHDKPRVPAEAKIGARLIRRLPGEPRQWWRCTSWPVPRSKYSPHQGKKECARRLRQQSVVKAHAFLEERV